MSITQRMLYEKGVSSTILANSRQTLKEVFDPIQDKNYPENNTYLVVAQPEEKFKVISLSDLTSILSKNDPDILTQPLSNLPIPEASRVIDRNTQESSSKILQWVRTHAPSTLVVTDRGEFTGLLVNQNCSGGLGLYENTTFWELYGSSSLYENTAINRLYGSENDEVLDNLLPETETQTCPNCQEQILYKFDTKTKKYICPNCRNPMP